MLLQWDEADEVCTGSSGCTSLNATNTDYSCCTYTRQINDGGTKKEETICLAIKKDENAINDYKEKEKTDNKDDGDYKFKGVDCDSKIAKLTFGLVMILAFFF